MIAPGEVAAIESALARFRAQLDDAKEAAGWGIGDWLFDAFYVRGTGHPRQDVRDAVLGGEGLYRALVDYRNRIVEAPGEMHEEAIEIVTIANRAAGWNRAASIESYREATNVPGAVGDAGKKAIDAALTGLGTLATVAIVLGVAFIIYKAKK